jgi:hypothetical protein
MTPAAPAAQPATQPAVMPCLHLSVSVPRPFDAVYGFLSDPANWTRWASGLGALRQDAAGAVWTAEQESGTVTIAFTPPNAFGILDHRVTLPDGSLIDVPMRAIANGGGTEVMITVFRPSTMDDATWARDQDWVRRDLQKLRRHLAEA